MHAAGVRVEPVLRPVVPDVDDRVARESRDVDVGVRRDLAGDDHEARRDQRLARDPPGRVVGEDGVEHGVRDLVGDLVGVTFRHRLGAEDEFAHAASGPFGGWN